MQQGRHSTGTLFGSGLEDVSRRFDPSKPIGFCIYCGERRGEVLTDEHMAPEALQGTLVLKKASCRACAGLTGYSELRTLRGPLWAAREHFGFYGDRRSADRPSLLPLEILRRDWTVETLSIPVAEFPLVFRMPRFPAPRFLQPPHSEDADFLRKHDYRQIDTQQGIERLRAILAADPAREKAVLDMEVFELSKVLAKIAYCFAVYFLGPYSIRPYVTNIIIAPRDHAPSFLHYIGGAFFAGGAIEQLTTTHIGKCTVRVETYDGRQIVLARVQLLAPLGAPVYEVVVGELMAPSDERTIYVPTPAVQNKSYLELKNDSLAMVLSATR